MIKLILLLVVLIYPCNSRVWEYIGQHPELNRSFVDALNQCQLYDGMTQDQVIVVKGLPIADETFEFKAEGKNFVCWRYSWGESYIY
jgi:outer membrane protein assembly factor BamE (lipoprotein component of BamABCDE complex)